MCFVCFKSSSALGRVAISHWLRSYSYPYVEAVDLHIEKKNNTTQSYDAHAIGSDLQENFL